MYSCDRTVPMCTCCDGTYWHAVQSKIIVGLNFFKIGFLHFLFTNYVGIKNYIVGCKHSRLYFTKENLLTKFVKTSSHENFVLHAATV